MSGMLRIAVVAVIAILPVALVRPDHRPAPRPADHFVIARHSSFDFGPPLDYYELFFINREGNSSSVKRITMIPRVDICRSPEVYVETGSIAASPEALLGSPNVCAISEKELKREFKRCKKCVVYSSVDVRMQVECDGASRTIRSKILDRDMFDPHPNTPEHTTWTEELLEQLDTAVGPGVIHQTMFSLADKVETPRLDRDLPALQELGAGRYDALFEGARDKPSDLYHDAQLPDAAPTIRLTNMSPSEPAVSALPKYPPIARLAHVQGSVSFTIEVDAEGTVLHVSAQGPRLLSPVVENTLRDWKFPDGDSNRRFEGSIEFALNCSGLSK
jgi:hypothetical protein